MMIEPVSSLINGAGNFFADRDTRDRQLRAASAIRLHENANGKTLRRFIFSSL